MATDSLKLTPPHEIDQMQGLRGTGFYVNNSRAGNLFAVVNGKFVSFCVLAAPSSDRCLHASVSWKLDAVYGCGN